MEAQVALWAKLLTIEDSHTTEGVPLPLGVTATEPETAYRWIEPGRPLGLSPLYEVRKFWEKPSIQDQLSAQKQGLWCAVSVPGRGSTQRTRISRRASWLEGTEAARWATDGCRKSLSTAEFPARVSTVLHPMAVVLAMPETAAGFVAATIENATTSFALQSMISAKPRTS
jgi:hypothetical protein